MPFRNPAWMASFPGFGIWQRAFGSLQRSARCALRRLPNWSSRLWEAFTNLAHEFCSLLYDNRAAIALWVLIFAALFALIVGMGFGPLGVGAGRLSTAEG